MMDKAIFNIFKLQGKFARERAVGTAKVMGAKISHS